MTKANYTEEADRLAKAIDIAIEAFQKFTKKDWDEKVVQHCVKVYSEIKDSCVNPETKFKTLGSLRYSINDVLTYFQESSGQDVEYFWQQVKLQELGYKRKNRLSKILKRNRIKDQTEYDFIIDVLVPYQQEGIITPDEVIAINQMIQKFESK